MNSHSRPVVLFVEDDPNWREELVPRALRDCNCTLWSTDRPERALEVIQGEDPPDVLLSDIVLLGSFLDGVRLIQSAVKRGIRSIAISSLPGLAPSDVPVVDKRDLGQLKGVLEGVMRPSGTSPTTPARTSAAPSSIHP